MADHAPRPNIVEGRFAPTIDVPFSATLDALIAEIRDGGAPNLGRFCGYCATPLLRDAEGCPTCHTSTAALPPTDKIPRPLARVYTAKRRREARWVHSAAWAGILIGAAVSTGLIVVLPGWTKIFAVVFLILGSYYLASYLGNVLVQDFAFRRGLDFFAREWQVYRATQNGQADRA